MRSSLKRYLFSKSVLVTESCSENRFETLFSLAKLFDIKITSGGEWANEELISYISDMIGEDVPTPFYRNFPATAKSLTTNELLYDQLNHYAMSYGESAYSGAHHSVFEADFDRLAFGETTDIKKFRIVPEFEAGKLLSTYVEDMMKGTRPLEDSQYRVVKSFIEEYSYELKNCACKDTAIRLLLDTRELKYTDFLSLSDVIKLVDTLNYQEYWNPNIKKLNLINQDRKLISNIIDRFFEGEHLDIRECFEKKAIWCGLLHHIHYKPKNPDAVKFVSLIRGRQNYSVYAEFEQAMHERDIVKAVTSLKEGKGSGALLRKLNYILSRCKDEKEMDFVINSIDFDNPILLIQLIMQYANYFAGSERVFKFTKFNRMRVHRETALESARRKSVLSEDTVATLYELMSEKLKNLLHGKLGKVFISPEMYNVALPLQENTSNGGYGVLPKGSRIHLEEGKKIRAFSYWEKIDDVDLSVIGITDEGKQKEFSWRTMFACQSEELTFSGDQTLGYNGGSEYFDLDSKLFKDRHPEIKCLVFCDNTFSNCTFQKCTCRAGYMLRDLDDSGEVFEPRTVKSSFAVNCDSTFAYLFGIDLETNDFVWLNVDPDSEIRVAGKAQMAFLLEYFKITSIMNVGMVFEMLATEVVESADEADVIVSDGDYEGKDGATTIHSFDFEKITALISK